MPRRLVGGGKTPPGSLAQLAWRKRLPVPKVVTCGVCASWKDSRLHRRPLSCEEAAASAQQMLDFIKRKHFNTKTQTLQKLYSIIVPGGCLLIYNKRKARSLHIGFGGIVGGGEKGAGAAEDLHLPPSFHSMPRKGRVDLPAVVKAL